MVMRTLLGIAFYPIFFTVFFSPSLTCEYKHAYIDNHCKYWLFISESIVKSSLFLILYVNIGWIGKYWSKANSTKEPGIANIWRKALISVSIEPSYSPPSMVLNRGYPTAITYNSLNTSISAVSIPPSTFIGVTLSPTLRSSNKWKSPALKPCC